MKVRDLIEQLALCDPDAEVVFPFGEDEGFDPVTIGDVVKLGPAKVHKSSWRSLYPPTEDANAKTGVCLGFDWNSEDYISAKAVFDAWLAKKK